MTHIGYLVAGYTITFGAIGAYAAWVLARSRAVARLLESEGEGGSERVDQPSASVERAGSG